MVVYEATKDLFMQHVEEDLIAQKIYQVFQTKIGKTSQNEFKSWDHSLQYMYKVLNSTEIPDRAGIAIEYRLPATSKRVDFIITGIDAEDRESAVIIELKQWEKAFYVDGKKDIVRTYVGGREREVPHPSYQAWSYASVIMDYNETVQKELIALYPCAYMHNYHPNNDDPILDENLYPCIEDAPLFKSGDVIKLRDFIARYIKKADSNHIMYKIENGRIRPSKSLQDALVKMMQGNQEFVMIDSQKVVYETALVKARQAYKEGKKEVIIVEGGPGTGKSVLAINLLVQLTSEEMVCQYVSKNSAPRNVYKNKLQSGYRKKFIDNLFKGTGAYYEAKSNEIDVLIVDEAHRLNEKSGMFMNLGENQTKEIIETAKCSIFFIDEYQKVTASDVGKIEDIVYFAKKAGAHITRMELDSQFRCNGSDGYLAWLDDVLGIRETANDIGFEGDYLFEIVDDPNRLYELIAEKNAINNKARLVAGYCWEWIKEGKDNPSIHDINIPEFNFSMSWNLGSTSTWAIDQTSVNQVGCIHTCQGLEFDYVGVIIGEDLRYEDEKVITDFSKRATTDKSLNGIKGDCRKGNEYALNEADKIIRNTYRTLMSRGQKGCFVYCLDKNLTNYLRRRLKISMQYQVFTNEVLVVAESSEEYKV